MEDDLLVEVASACEERPRFSKECPRKVLGYKSGEGLGWCTAEHAERNTIANAARLGVSTLGTTLYMNCVFPCKSCLTLLTNAGIKEIVIESAEFYDKQAKQVYLRTSPIVARVFHSNEIIGGKINGFVI